MHYNLIKRASRAFLEEMANIAHQMPELYKAIDTLQETPFILNKRVYQVMKTIYEKKLAIAGFPSHKLELPIKPNDIATNEDARKKYSQRKRAVCDYNSTIDSKFIHIQKIFSVADTYEQF